VTFLVSSIKYAKTVLEFTFLVPPIKYTITIIAIVYISPTHALYVKTLHKHTKIVN